MKCQPKSLTDTMIFFLRDLPVKELFIRSFRDIFLSIGCFFAFFMVE